MSLSSGRCALLSVSIDGRHRAMTLIELMMAVAIGSTVLLVSLTSLVYAIRSTAAIWNYVDMNNSSRSALSRMTRDIRKADKLISFSTTQMVFQTTDPNDSTNVTQFSYTYDPVAKTLTSTAGGQTKVLLKGCQVWQPAFYQRNTVGGTYDQYPVDDSSRPDLCKVVQLTWSCSRTVSGQPANTEGLQSAKVVMRKP